MPTFTSYEECQKELVQQLLLEAAECCLIAKRKNKNGKLPHGCMTTVLAEIGCPQLNQDKKVNYKISQLELEVESKLGPNTLNGAIGSTVEVGDDALTTNISTLTSPSMLSQLTEDTDSSGSQEKRRTSKKVGYCR